MTCWKCGLPLCGVRLCNSAGGSHFFHFPHGATPWSDSFTIEFRMASQVYISLRWLNLQLIRTELLRTITHLKDPVTIFFHFPLLPLFTRTIWKSKLGSTQPLPVTPIEITSVSRYKVKAKRVAMGFCIMLAGLGLWVSLGSESGHVWWVFKGPYL